MQISLARVHQLIDELREQYQREEEQGILQRDMDKAVRALVGKDACNRIKNQLSMGVDMDANYLRVMSEKKRA